jgi:cellulose synthase/poly-beta-1,6-N-acetylglucosamine synthase-like glycosyltransferase
MLLLVVLYQLAAVWLALYGLNSLLLTILYFWLRRRAQPMPTPPAEWPVVTVQLPIYNEKHVAERLIAAVAELDYPRDALQIQVLDDSTDETAALMQQSVARYARQGIDIQHVRRVERAGFKAGALAEGLRQARGEFLAIFDADFVPPADFLRRTIPYFAAPDIGCVQARWGHLNRGYSMLTQVQAIGIDGHFLVEQRARSQAGLFLNFNGSAGVWRRACVEHAGGWQSDTLAEDLDLSYRAQLAGWRIVYAADVVVPAELPPQMDALRRQQSRWAQGSIRVALKLLPSLLRSRQAWLVKVEGALHLTGYLVHPLILVVSLLSMPLVLVQAHPSALAPCFLFAAVGPPLLYLVAQAERGAGWWRQIKFLPLLLLLGAGLALNNTLAMLRAVLGRGGEFQRTPKFDIRDARDHWQGSAYALRCSPLVWGELLMAVAAQSAALIEWLRTGYVLFWLVICGLGYAYVAATSLLQSWQAWRRAARSTRLSVRMRTALKRLL